MLQHEFSVGGRLIGSGYPPYVIAEAGSNFNQSLDTARRLIDAAAKAGAEAVKFQLFKAESLYPDGGEMFDIFKSIELDADWLPALKDHASKTGLAFSELVQREGLE